MAVERIKTGIEGFDDLIEGGLPKGSCVLVSGSAGTGKTIFGLQFLYEGAKNKEPGIYVTFSESKKSAILCAKKLNMNLDEMEKEKKFSVLEYMEIGNEIYLEEISRLRKVMEELMKKKKIIGESRGFTTNDIDTQITDIQNRIKEIGGMMAGGRPIISQDQRERMFFERLQKVISDTKAERLVIDSLSAYAIYNGTRESLHRFIKRLEKLGVTTILVSEAPEGSKDIEKIAEYLVDGVITLVLDETMDIRKIGIKKLRGTKHTLKPQTFLIGDGGIKLKK